MSRSWTGFGLICNVSASTFLVCTIGGYSIKGWLKITLCYHILKVRLSDYLNLVEPRFLLFFDKDECGLQWLRIEVFYAI